MIAKSCSLEEIRRLLFGKKILCFGAGLLGGLWYNELIASGHNVVGFIDNDIKKQDADFLGLPVYSAKRFGEIKSDEMCVIVTVANSDSILEIVRLLEEKYDMRNGVNLFVFNLPSESCVSDADYLKFLFKNKMGRTLNLDAPKTFNEKLQWLKLYDRKPVYTKMSDKYETRGIISKIIGDDYLVSLLGVWDKADDIDFESLPSQFVLKCNHDSGSAVFCRNKNNFDIINAREKLNECLGRNYYWHGREWAYKDIKPRIICEEYLGDDPIDYKLMCFNGKVRCSFTCSDRKTGLKVTFYDASWKRMPFERHYPSSKIDIPKPKRYDEMVVIAETLSEKIPFLRVDFYLVGERLILGELTFYPGNGHEEFTPDEYDYMLGEWLHLPFESKKGV